VSEALLGVSIVLGFVLMVVLVHSVAPFLRWLEGK
jgi:hypothetical protein